MTAFISWTIVITLLGWLTFPLIYHLFPALADRRNAVERRAGMIVAAGGDGTGRASHCGSWASAQCLRPL